jgi:hypothetical protein
MTAALNLAATHRILAEVAAERERQHARWGQQDLPLANPQAHTGAARCAMHGLPFEVEARRLCEARTKYGTLSYADIIVEELVEAIAASALGAARAELVQAAACIVQAIESIDRRRA